MTHQKETALHWRAWLPDFVFLALLWGSSFLFMREGAHAFGAFPTAWVRVSSAAVMLMPVLIWRGYMPVLHANWRHAFFSGLLNSGIPFVCYAFALMSISTGLSSILNATTPLFGAVVAWYWLGDKLNVSRAIGLALGFAGVVLLASDVPGGGSFNAGGSGFAVLACLFATFCYGLAGSYMKKYLPNIPSIVTACGSLCGASLFLCVPAWWAWPAEVPPMRAWIALGIAGLLCTALAYVLFFRLMTRIGPARAMTVTYLIPVFANLVGVLVLDEVVTPWMMLCGAVILAGTALASGFVSVRLGLGAWFRQR